MNDGIIYETVNVRFSEGGDALKMEEICIEFLHQGTYVSILLNGIDRTEILRRLLAFEAMYRPIKLIAYKLESIFNKFEYNSLPKSLLKSLIGNSNFHRIQLYGDANIIRELNRFGENRAIDLTSGKKAQNRTFQSIVTIMKNRIHKKRRDV